MSQPNKVMKVFESVVYGVSGLFSGYDDSGTTQSTLRTINNSSKLVQGTEIIVDTDRNLSLVEHPVVKVVVGTTRILGSAVASISNVVVTKNRQDEAQTDQETLDADQQTAREIELKNLITRLENDPQYVVNPQLENMRQMFLKFRDDYYDPEELTIELNCAHLRFILADYRSHRKKISAYDAHKLRSVLAAITEDDPAVRQAVQNFMLADADEIKNRQNNREAELVAAAEAVMRRRLNFTQKKSKARRFVEKLQRAGDSVFSGTTAMSVVSGFSSTLLSIPVVNLIVAGVMIGCAGVATVTRLLRDFLFEKQHRRSKKKSDNVATRDRHKNLFKALSVDMAKLNTKTELPDADQYRPQLGAVVNPNISADVENPHIAHKAQFGIGVTARTVATASLSIVIGWFMIDTIMKVVTGFGGTALAAGSQAALAVPIAGVIIAGALFLSKTALDIYRANKEEQKVIADLNAKKVAMRDNLTADAELRTVAALNDAALLRTYIQSYLEMKDDPCAESKEAFMQRIENMIGFNRPLVNKDKDYDSGTKLFGYTHGAAKTNDDFYSFLAGKLSDPGDGELSKVDLARQVKHHMTGNNDVNIVTTDKKVKNTWVDRVFRRKVDDPTQHDHMGNFRRFMTLFKDIALLAFSSLGPIGIGFAVATVVASGPYFPIVAAVMAATLITAFTISKVIEYKRDERKEVYNQEMTKMAIQDKTAEYAKLRAERALADAAVHVPEAPVPPVHVPAPAPVPQRLQRVNSDTALLSANNHSFIATSLSDDDFGAEDPIIESPRLALNKSGL